VTQEKVAEITRKPIQYNKMMKVMVSDKQAIQQQLEKRKAALKPF
jgi:hypothetical protein